MNQLLSGKLGLLARVLVLALGSLAVLSYLIGQEGLRTYSIVSVTSPLPIVFSRYGSQENYGSVVTVRYVEQDGQAAEKQLKPDDFKIAGPYSRRAVYVGIFALGVEADKERPI